MGMVLGTELLRPEPTLQAMYGIVPMTLVHMLTRLGIVPEEIRVRSSVLFQLLALLGEELGFKVQRSAILPSLDSAKQFLMQRF
jgi:hypothetical protein